jgi:hypothetical protein
MSLEFHATSTEEVHYLAEELAHYRQLPGAGAFPFDVSTA